MDATFFGDSLPLLNLLGLVIVGGFLMFKTIKSNASSIDAGTIASLKLQIDAVQNEGKLYKQQVLELTERVGKQDGIIQTQAQQIDKYEKIFQNRNPELTKVLEEIRDFMMGLEKKTDVMIGELSYQTTILDADQERHLKLDKTHGMLASVPPAVRS